MYIIKKFLILEMVVTIQVLEDFCIRFLNKKIKKVYLLLLIQLLSSLMHRISSERKYKIEKNVYNIIMTKNEIIKTPRNLFY